MIQSNKIESGDVLLKVLDSLDAISEGYGFKKIEYIKGQEIPMSSKMILDYFCRNFGTLDIIKAFEYATISGLNLESYGKILTITMLGCVLSNYRDFKRKESVRLGNNIKMLPEPNKEVKNINARLLTLYDFLNDDLKVLPIHYRLIDEYLFKFPNQIKVNTYRECLESEKNRIDLMIPTNQQERQMKRDQSSDSAIKKEAKIKAQIKIATDWLEMNGTEIDYQEARNNIINNKTKE